MERGKGGRGVDWGEGEGEKNKWRCPRNVTVEEEDEKRNKKKSEK